jgi:hypothetical protein
MELTIIIYGMEKDAGLVGARTWPLTLAINCLSMSPSNCDSMDHLVQNSSNFFKLDKVISFIVQLNLDL